MLSFNFSNVRAGSFARCAIAASASGEAVLEESVVNTIGTDPLFRCMHVHSAKYVCRFMDLSSVTPRAGYSVVVALRLAPSVLDLIGLDRTRGSVQIGMLTKLTTAWISRRKFVHTHFLQPRS